MGPKGKSKAQVEKQNYLGKFTKLARNVEQMKLLIQSQESEKIELEKRLQENNNLIQVKQSELKNHIVS